MRLTFWVALLTFLADQISKLIILRWLDLNTVGSLDVLPPYLNVRRAWNYGINFGLGASGAPGMRWLLIGIALAITLGVLIWMARGRHGRLAYFSGGLLIGGAIGNVLDRIFYGAVADFLNMSCCGIENPYSFNIADIAIFAGAFGLIFFADPKKAT